jgi:hypothetical protein
LIRLPIPQNKAAYERGQEKLTSYRKKESETILHTSAALQSLVKDYHVKHSKISVNG